MHQSWSSRKSKDALSFQDRRKVELSEDFASATNEMKENENSIPEQLSLLEEVLERTNMFEALKKVEDNAGVAGVDGLSTKELRDYLKQHWVGIRQKLLEGNYYPEKVLGVEIPKSNGKKRQLGIPVVVDRLIQQALLRRLNLIFDKDFSNSSFGYREGKRAQDALVKAKDHINKEDKTVVVDIDLAQFFDEVNHDRLLGKLSKKIKDSRVLILIKRYLQAGILKNGVLLEREKGTPQGGPLSPLLSNIVLDELDKELEKRGHSFCRYVDDCNIYVKTKRAGERVLKSVTTFIEKKLKLKVNLEKSASALVTQRKFLGYTFYKQKGVHKFRVANEKLESFKEKVKKKFKKSQGKNLGRFCKEELNPLLRGWINYFILAEGTRFAEDLDGWIRRKLRCNLWRQWKRGWTRRNKLMAAGLSEERAVMTAFNGYGPWYNSGKYEMNEAYPKKYFDKIGLVSLTNKLREFRSVNLLT